MSKLIVLSNRVNLPNKQSSKAVAGGLAVALQEALAKDGGIWVGWNGQVVTNISDMPDTVNQFATEQHDKVTYVTTAFSPCNMKNIIVVTPIIDFGRGCMTARI